MHSVATLLYSLVVVVALQSVIVPVACAADESVIVVVKVFPTVGREDELQIRYEKQLDFLRKAEPNASFRLHRSAKSPTIFMWYERYESQAALDSHLKLAMPAFRKEHGATAEGLIARPSESETYREIKQ